MKRDAGLSGGVSGAVLAGTKMLVILPLSVVYVLDAAIRALIPRRFKRTSVGGANVLITGGGSGLGRELAIRFARAGANVSVWGRNEKNLQETCRLSEESGKGSCSYNSVDVTNRETVYAESTNLLNQIGKLDILVNNAGVVYGKNILDTKDDEIQNTFNVNIISHFYTTKSFLPEMMKQNKGHIVTVSSLGGYQAVNKMTDYCASKFATVGFNESLTMELRVNGYSGVKTTLVCPYYIDTGMFSGIQSKLVPVMTTEFVADETFDAILMQKRFCVLPWYGNLSIFLSSFIPEKLLYLVARVMGLTEGLSNFRGRHKQA